MYSKRRVLLAIPAILGIVFVLRLWLWQKFINPQIPESSTGSVRISTSGTDTSCDKMLLEYGNPSNIDRTDEYVISYLDSVWDIPASQPIVVASSNVYFLNEKPYVLSGLQPDWSGPTYIQLRKGRLSDILHQSSSSIVMGELPETAGYAPPSLQISGSIVLVYFPPVTWSATSTSLITAVDLATGEVAWKSSIHLLADPIAVANSIYVQATEGLESLNAKQGTVNWIFEGGHGTPFPTGTVVYIDQVLPQSTSSIIYALDSRTGKIVGRFQIMFDDVQGWGDCGRYIYFETGGFRARVGRIDPQLGTVTYVGTTLP